MYLNDKRYGNGIAFYKSFEGGTGQTKLKHHNCKMYIHRKRPLCQMYGPLIARSKGLRSALCKQALYLITHQKKETKHY